MADGNENLINTLIDQLDDKKMGDNTALIKQFLKSVISIENKMADFSDIKEAVEGLSQNIKDMGDKIAQTTNRLVKTEEFIAGTAKDKEKGCKDCVNIATVTKTIDTFKEKYTTEVGVLKEDNLKIKIYIGLAAAISSMITAGLIAALFKFIFKV